MHIHVASGITLSAVGDIEMTAVVGGQPETITLSGVLHIPGPSYNLLSLPQAACRDISRFVEQVCVFVVVTRFLQHGRHGLEFEFLPQDRTRSVKTTNYLAWSEKTQAVLSLKGLWEVVKHEPAAAVRRAIEAEEAPAGTTEASNRAKDAYEKNKLAVIHLKLSVKDEIVPRIRHLKVAKDVWDLLESRYASMNAARKQQLRRELNTITLGKSESITAYFNRGRNIVVALSGVGHEVSDADLTLVLLDGLPAKYEATVDAILGANVGDLDYHDVLTRLMSKEKRGGGSSADSNSGNNPRRGTAIGSTRQEEQEHRVLLLPQERAHQEGVLEVEEGSGE